MSYQALLEIRVINLLTLQVPTLGSGGGGFCASKLDGEEKWEVFGGFLPKEEDPNMDTQNTI